MNSDDPAAAASTPEPVTAPARVVARRLPDGIDAVVVAREVVTAILDEQRPGLSAAAGLAVSEIVTNAVLHGRGPIELTIALSDHGCRVAVYDDDPHLPRLRWYSDTAATGRGLHLVDSVADRWGAARHGAGKVVWFELGEPVLVPAEGGPYDGDGPGDQAVVRLLDCPLLLHLAWQERCQTVLREYVSATLASQPSVLRRHAEASAALNVLYERIPAVTRADPAAPLIDALEPAVTAPVLELRLTREATAQLGTLRRLLAEAASTVRPGTGRFPSHPELDRFQDWLFGEVDRQSAGAAAQPWLPPLTDHVPATADGSPSASVAAAHHAWPPDGCHVVMDAAGLLVHVSPPVRTALGYRAETDLVGRPLLALVPERFRQAHLAGTALHVTGGRDVIFRHPVTVPMLAADGTEVRTRLRVHRDRLPQGAEVYVGDLEFLAG